MTTKPVILITHSRSCSTVIERVFWANDDIKCYHEHFGDAYYFGSEKISDNWKHWPADRIEKTGKGQVTYRSALKDILQGQRSQKYVFNKDMSYHILPPKNSTITEIASLIGWDDAAACVRQNPTWLPTSAVRSFRFAFLIRSPWLAVPSLYRLHVPPAVYETFEPNFKPMEIGYREMRVLIEYLYPQLKDDVIKDHGSEHVYGNSLENDIKDLALVDASDVLAAPEKMLQRLCDKIGLPFSPSMLSWNPHNAEMEKEMSKFPGFHTDAISSSGLRSKTKDEEERAKARDAQKKRPQDNLGMEMSEDEYIFEWTERYGEEAAGKILEAVQLCRDDYVWLKRFTMKVA